MSIRSSYLVASVVMCMYMAVVTYSYKDTDFELIAAANVYDCNACV